MYHEVNNSKLNKYLKIVSFPISVCEDHRKHCQDQLMSKL